MKNERTIIDYRSINSMDKFRQFADSADLIYAVDRGESAGGEVLVCGQDRLRQIKETGQTTKLAVAYIAIDFNTEQVEHLMAGLSVTKGYYCWNGELTRAS